MERLGLYIFTVVYAAFWVGLGFLVKRYPTTISGFSTMSNERRQKYDMEKVGRFVSKWLYAAAIVVVLSMLLPARLHVETLIVAPILFIFLCAGYLLKYQDNRFKKE